MQQVTGTEQDNSLYRKDAFIQSWMDRRYIATLIKWLESQGVQPRYMSEVLNSAMITMVNTLVKQDQVSLVQFTSEADQVIKRTVRTKLNPSGRGNKNYQINLELDDARFEAIGRPTQSESARSQAQQQASDDADKEMAEEIKNLIRKGEV